jgi:peptide/nickel transport system permease protein
MGIIASRMGNTILLASCAILVSVFFGVSVGIFSAKRRKTMPDSVISVLTFLVISLPSFFFGMLLIKVFAVDMRLFPISGKTTVYADYTGFAYALDVLRHMALPVIVLGLSNAAMMLRYTRSSVIGILTADYIRAARAHGIRERAVTFRHVLKNILIPIVTVLSLQIPDLLSGALLIETVFVWPGVGRLSYEAIGHRDYPLIMGILLVMAALTLTANLIADVCYALIDPRIKLEKHHV